MATDDEAGPSIVVDGLTKTFSGGSIIAAEDINLSISSDEFVVFLGPSGCGKTTTLRCISGLETPDSGNIYIHGEDVTTKKPKDRDLAFVFQDIALFPHMSVRKNIRFGLDMNTNLSQSEKQERVESVAKLLGISELLDRRTTELSGGQQQRVSLGRAMVTEPVAFLLDEPFSALDANLRDKMRVEIKKLQRELNTAMIFVTHDQEEAMTLGDSIVILDEGRIQQIGSPYEIYNEPNNLFVAQFIGSPSTNLFECNARLVNKTIVLENEMFSFELSEAQTNKVDTNHKQSLIMGIRPEHITLTEEGNGLFEAELQVIEHHGDRDAVHILASENEFTAVTPQNQFENRGQRLQVSFDANEFWLFDGSGRRLI